MLVRNTSVRAVGYRSGCLLAAMVAAHRAPGVLEYWLELRSSRVSPQLAEWPGVYVVRGIASHHARAYPSCFQYTQALLSFAVGEFTLKLNKA